MKINVKHKTYEVICPVSGKHVFVRGLTIAEQNILDSKVTSFTEGLKLLLNVFYDAIQNKEVYRINSEDKDEDLFDSFLKQTHWDDITAIAIGILSRMKSSDTTLDLTVTCQNTNASKLNEKGICGHKYSVSFSYDNLVSRIRINEEQEPIFTYSRLNEQSDYNLILKNEYPNMFKELQVLEAIDKLNRSDKIWKKHNISEYHKDAILATVYIIPTVPEIIEYDNPDNKIIIDFNNNKGLNLDSVIEYGKVLSDLETLDILTQGFDLDKYGLESKGVGKCPVCKYKTTLDLKEWILDTFFPAIDQ